MEYQGGEVVVGFFFDGKDAQQPVIFGTLFKQSFIEDGLKNSEFDIKKQTCFVPYTPPDVRATAGDHERSATGTNESNGNGMVIFYGNDEWKGNHVKSSDISVSDENLSIIQNLN